MTTALAERAADVVPAVVITNEQIALIKQTIAQDATDAELKLFCRVPGRIGGADREATNNQGLPTSHDLACKNVKICRDPGLDRPQVADVNTLLP